MTVENELDVEPAPPSSTSDWHRLNPKMLLIHPVKELGRALPGLVILIFAGNGNGDGALWGLGGAVVVMFFALSRWFTTRYHVDAEQVQIHEGLLRRRSLSARVDRIRTVDVTSHFLHRAFGLAKVEIGTGVSDRKGKSVLALDGLPADDAARLRGDLLHRARLHTSAATAATATAGAPAGVAAGTATSALTGVDTPPDGATVARTDHDWFVGEADEVEIAHFDNRWLRYAPFTLSGVFTGLAIIAFFWRFVSESNVDPENVGPLHDATRQLSGVSLWVAIFEVVVAVIVFIAAASTVRYVLSYWNFRLSRHAGGTIHISRGLLTTRATSIETSRLAGVGISEPLMQRLVGGGRMVAIATGLRVGRGSSSGSRGGTVVLPDAPIDEVNRVASALLGVDGISQVELVSHGPIARRRRFTRALAGAVGLVAVAAAVTWIFGLSNWYWIASLLFVVVAVPLAADRARSLGHAVTNGFLVTRSGSFARRRATFEVGAIIGWTVRQSFFQRRAGVATLIATTAAGRQSYQLRDLPVADVVAVAESAVPDLLKRFAVRA